MLRGSIEHTEETCIRLALVQNKCYGRARVVVRAVLSIVPIIIGVLVGYDHIVGLLLILLGVYIWFTTSTMYENDAKKALEGTPEEYRKVEYLFDKKLVVKAGGLERKISYKDIISLVTDGDYLYLFVNAGQAYMVKSEDNEQTLMEFLEKETGKNWNIITVKEPMFAVLKKSLKARFSLKR